MNKQGYSCYPAIEKMVGNQKSFQSISGKENTCKSQQDILQDFKRLRSFRSCKTGFEFCLELLQIFLFLHFPFPDGGSCMKFVSREKFDLFKEPFRSGFQDAIFLHLREQFIGQCRILLRTKVIQVCITNNLVHQIRRGRGQSGDGNHPANRCNLILVVSKVRKDLCRQLGGAFLMTAVLFQVPGIVEECGSLQ